MGTEPIAKTNAPEDDENRNQIPSQAQRKVFWYALACLSTAIIIAFFIGIIYYTNIILSYLQPVLVPLAVAGIIAYLLEPLVEKLNKRGISRRISFLTVYIGFLASLVILITLVIVPSWKQFSQLIQKEEIEKIEKKSILFIENLTKNIKQKTGITLSSSAVKGIFSTEDGKIKKEIVDVSQKVLGYIGKGFSGLVGVLGYIIGIFLIPIYLYYFLKESQRISEAWTDYVPLKRSNFRDEVVATIEEINSYLIAFFRGQMLVSMLDGLLVGIALWLVGLKYTLLIGVFVGLLGIIPYIGNLICLIPAVLIAIAQVSDKSSEHWSTQLLPYPWVYPAIVICIFFLVQQINSLITAPKIVGNSVGLHPMTIIFSVLLWSLVLGGLFGALLAVPLTASIKVIFRRYVWGKKISTRLNSETATT